MKEFLTMNLKKQQKDLVKLTCLVTGVSSRGYGYSTPVVHCDLKTSNVLLDHGMVGHVCDFGIAKLLVAGQDFVQTRTTTTIGYIAPAINMDKME
ncbi:hypothetical protein KY290_001489 [Solanum tuberosum]|uniref:Protein kinase domain-containing protein n=1 Tax=Solanum tuberosum TaxID=4113 RepID=A0ABQ7WNQ0_SOLTU|nr:hypothetical protein KY290_001489 [Solanum tuberosum]